MKEGQKETKIEGYMDEDRRIGGYQDKGIPGQKYTRIKGQEDIRIEKYEYRRIGGQKDRKQIEGYEVRESKNMGI